MFALEIRTGLVTGRTDPTLSNPGHREPKSKRPESRSGILESLRECIPRGPGELHHREQRRTLRHPDKQLLVENSVLHGIPETEKNEGREKLDALVKDTAAKLSPEKTPRAKSKAKKGPEL